MATYRTKVDIEIDPVWHQDQPEIIVKIGPEWRWTGRLEKSTHFSHTWESSKGDGNVSVELLNKQDSDTVGNKDKAVIIKSVRLNDVSTDKLLWQGRYRPQYPEPWATEQRKSGQDLPEYLSAHTYLGWNGIWTLDFSIPVFTWIHRIEDLGWIYD